MPIDDRFGATASRAGHDKGPTAALNDRGHNLREHYPAAPGDFHFRGDQELNGQHQCGLSVARDVIAIAAYADTVDCGDELIS